MTPLSPKICAICGKSFSPKSQRQLYCGSLEKKRGCSYKNYITKGREYKTNNPARSREVVKQWKSRHQEKVREYNHAYNNKKRDLVFGHYGKKCACCSESNVLFLHLDHIKNDGADHRRRKGASGAAIYRDVIKMGFPKTFQTLCANCNMGKYRNGGICPHKNNV